MSEFIIMKNRIFVIFKGVRRLFEQVHNLSNVDYSILENYHSNAHYPDVQWHFAQNVCWNHICEVTPIQRAHIAVRFQDVERYLLIDLG